MVNWYGVAAALVLAIIIAIPLFGDNPYEL